MQGVGSHYRVVCDISLNSHSLCFVTNGALWLGEPSREGVYGLVWVWQREQVDMASSSSREWTVQCYRAGVIRCPLGALSQALPGPVAEMVHRAGGDMHLDSLSLEELHRPGMETATSSGCRPWCRSGMCSRAATYGAEHRHVHRLCNEINKSCPCTVAVDACSKKDAKSDACACAQTLL
jgi:hypothetical protein